MSDLEHVEMIPSTDTRLARHVVHDERSRAYALPAGAVPVRPATWNRQGPVFDQNVLNDGRGLGCCTACAGLGLLMTGPFAKTGRQFTIDDVVKLYSEETALDDREIPGRWPPDDTGSAGIYLMKALRNRGLITGYRHAFSLDAALWALQRGPIAVGSVWLNSMFEPRRDGWLVVDPRSGEAGGHEYVIDAYTPVTARQPAGVRLTNSWSTSWGRAGSAWLDVRDFGYLLSQQGDVVQPTVSVR